MRKPWFLFLLIGLLAGCGNGGLEDITQEPVPDSDNPGTPAGFKLGAVINGSFQEGVIFSTGDSVPANGSVAMRVNLLDASTGRAFTGDVGAVEFFTHCVLEDKATMTPQQTPFVNAVASTQFHNRGCSGETEIVASVKPAGGSEVTARKTLTLEPPIDVRFGTFDTSGEFVERVLSITPTTIQAGGTTQISVALIKSDGSLYRGAAALGVHSNCLSTDRATLSPEAPSFVDGEASFTYKANGCVGTEGIVAVAIVDGQTIQASGNVTVAAAPIAAVQFVSATPTTISLRGVGQPDSSVVTFRIVNTQGQTVSGAHAVFSLEPDNGSATFSPTEAVSGSDGLITTFVRGGVVHTSVRITASVGAGVPAGRSESLLIAGGIADQDSFSLAADCFNIEGLEYDGVTADFTIRAADRFNNPVPDGTAVAFMAEGGSIDSGCLTTAGACSVKFRSQAPRPDDGRASILAYAIGEESFLDTDGNFQYDAGELFTDLSDAFVDADEDNLFDAGIERLVDFDGDRTFGEPNGIFNGIACNSDSCSAQNAIHVRGQSVITLSGSHAEIDLAPSTIDLSTGDVAVTATISDVNGQPMPGNTTIEFSTTLGSLAGTSSFQQDCTTFNGPISYRVVLEAPEEVPAADTGTLSVKVKTPRGTETVQTASVRVSPTAPPPPATGDLRELQFVSATPQIIGVSGSPAPGTADVVFRAISTNGGNLANITVTFSLEPEIGGVTLSPVTVTTGSDGLARTQVRSGSVQTTVRINASGAANGVTHEALSDALTISTAIADQNSMSVSASILNIEGDSLDGSTTNVTARLADRFNNPVPDNTAVSFRTEGGSIEPSCRTVAGACSVRFVSQNPREANHRVTVMAFVTGEESFQDENGNGHYDAGEDFGDIGEVFVDADEDGAYDAGEDFVDFDGSTTRTGASGTFTGLLCGSGCDSRKSLHISDGIVLIMASSSANIAITPAATNITRATGARTFRVVVTDTAGQPMPAGTTITARSSYGTFVGESAFIQPNTNVQGGTVFQFVVKPPEPSNDDPDNDLQPGTVTVRVVSPSGVESVGTAQIN